MYVLKYYFCVKLTRSRGYRNELIEMLKKLSSLEPENYEWQHKLYKTYERRRQEHRDKSKRGVPCLEEAQALERAMELLGTKSDAEVHSGYMMHLTCSLGKFEDPTFELVFANRRFISNDEVIVELKKTARKINETEDNFVTPLWVAAKIFCSMLPLRYRDYDLATACCTKALQIRPQSSRALHQLGKIHEHQRNFIEAARLYREAYAADKTNLYALNAALKIMMLDPIQFEDQLRTFFAQIFPNQVLQNKKRERLHVHFCQGVFFMLMGDQDRGMKHLNSAMTEVEEEKIATYYYGAYLNQFRFNTENKQLIQSEIDRYLQGPPANPMNRKILSLRSIFANP